ncbi:ABC transporter substrate-binding protein [Streptacidiphilus sp. N1-12]|uniref:ABC transporter substrate-binding protein n=2 Tax=Streptacidiphilus alkalitolerans TaxID=3342712 RepID=A0ABV6VKE2_9ACTN
MRRALSAATLVTALCLLSGGCTSVNDDAPKAGAGSADTTPVTITFWHAFTDDREVSAVNAVLAQFHAKYPYITVKSVKGQTDDKINQAIRGGTAPDVAASFNAANVGGWCSSGAFQDLTPDLTADHVDLSRIPKAVQAYTAFGGKRCTMPWLADTFGLYYNRKLFTAAGISAPPKTMTELAADAVKLTTYNTDGSIRTAGFMPWFGGYEMLTEHLVPSWGGKWLKPDGSSDTATDPAFAQALTWQKNLVDAMGADKLRKFTAGMAPEQSAQMAFENGTLAMMVDGEWRTAFIKGDKSTVDYGTAPMPVADNKPELYGSGFVGGNVMGIPRGSKHPDAAWKLVEFLTTDTTAVVTLADAVGNVPTTLPALHSPELQLSKDPKFAPFLEVFGNPLTSSAPASADGGAYLTNFGPFAQKWQDGKVPDLQAGLAAIDQQNDATLKLGQ